MLMKYCSTCKKLVPYDHKHVRAHSRKKVTEQTKIRSTQRWKRLSRQIRERDHFLCQLCLSKHCLNNQELQVHHIVPIEVDQSLAYEPSNLITLCSSCHHEVEEEPEEHRATLEELVQLSYEKRYESDHWET